MKVFTAAEFDLEMDYTDVWQGWQFGPYLIEEDGTPRTDFSNYGIRVNNPRTVLGYFEPGHYCFVVVEGRQGKYSRGLTLSNLAQLMVDIGCTQAFNLDGGASTQLYWNSKLYNKPSGPVLRGLSDIIYICDPVGDVPFPYEMHTPEPTAEPKATDLPTPSDDDIEETPGAEAAEMIAP